VKSLHFLLAGLAVLLLAGVLLFFQAGTPSSRTTGPRAGTGTPAEGTQGIAASGSGAASSAAVRPGRAEAAQAIQAALASFRARPEEGGEILAGLRRRLLALSPDEAVAAILDFLNGGEDASTGLGFTLVEGGRLDEAPTLRVALLDLLGQMDVKAGADYAKVILALPNSADEWAVALRNYSWTGDSARTDPYLRGKVSELVRNKQWASDPSPGYLEAFDMAVYTRNYGLLPDFDRNVNQTGMISLRMASFMAVDKLVVEDPEGAFRQLEDNRALFNGQPLVRGGLYARADVRDPVQRQSVEAYLLRTDLSPVEIDKFAALFPNVSQSVGDYLVTKNQIKKLPAMADLDEASLQVVQQWMKDPRFAGRREALAKISDKLGDYVSQSKHQDRNGF
jgi:hypothetical protein